MNIPSTEQGRKAIFLSVSLLSGIALLFAFQGLVHRFRTCPAFHVAQVEVVWLGTSTASPEQFRFPTPTPIFNVDLTAIRQNLRKEYPADEIQAVRRVLPNRVVATLRKREALALVRSGRRWYPVSQDGTVVGKAQGPSSYLPLLTIKGFTGRFEIGESISIDTFAPSAKLLSALQSQSGLADHQARRLRVGNKELFLTLDSGLEIRFSIESLWEGWHQLGELLSARPELLTLARYIDLRFEDPAIGGLQ